MSEGRIYRVLDLKGGNLLVGFKNQVKTGAGKTAVSTTAGRIASCRVLLVITIAASLKGANESLIALVLITCIKSLFHVSFHEIRH